MNALNSFAYTNNYTIHDIDRIYTETTTRVFESKGLFIIPYDLTKIVAYVKVDFKMIYLNQEYRSLWTNPELSFYGYAHIRQNKRPIGSPVQLNLRDQTVLYWHPLEPYSQIETIGTILNLARFLGSQFEFGRLLFPGPIVSDVSFGFKVPGRYAVSVSIGYWHEWVWPLIDIPRPTQHLPNPDLTKNTPPPTDDPVGDPFTPLSPSYLPNDDYGESDPTAPEPPPPPGEFPASPFVIRWSANGPGFNDVNVPSFEYTGPQITGYNPVPQLIQNQYVIVVTHATGTANVALGRGAFVTQEQADAFLDTFEILEFEEI